MRALLCSEGVPRLMGEEKKQMEGRAKQMYLQDRART
jgi:hypothetical protein